MLRFLICTVFLLFAACQSSVTDECEEAAVCDPESLPGEFSISTAAPGKGVVVLAWDTPINTESFIVKRGTASGVYDTTVSENAESPLIDSDLTGGTTYFYMVTAVNANGTRDALSEISATPTAED